MRTVAGSILTSGKHFFVEIWLYGQKFYGRAVVTKECGVSTGKLRMRLAQEQCG